MKTLLQNARSMLADHWLFTRLTDAEIDRLVAQLRLRKYAPNEQIFLKGDDGSSMMVVTRGEVKISAPSMEGKSVTLNIVKTGEIFGEIALLDGGERTANANAIAATELLILERRDFLPLLDRHPKMARKLLEIVCQRLRRTSEQVEDNLFLVRPARLAKALLRLADEFGVVSPDGTRIEINLSQSELGNLTGLTRESINKQLAEWRKERLVYFDRGSLTIFDKDRLERLVAKNN